MFKGNVEEALFPAAAIELIHTYSLIHDDLPCMDNDDMRRGKPTLHKVHDEATALLVGDYLLTYAFEVLMLAPHLSCGTKVALTKVLTKAIGAQGMVGGQLLDWQKHKDKKEIDRKKTAALFACSTQFGGILTKQPDNVLTDLYHLGETIGLLFQLADDIQDNEARSSHEIERLADQAFTLLAPYDSSTIKEMIERIVFSCTHV